MATRHLSSLKMGKDLIIVMREISLRYSISLKTIVTEFIMQVLLLLDLYD